MCLEALLFDTLFSLFIARKILFPCFYFPWLDFIFMSTDDVSNSITHLILGCQVLTKYNELSSFLSIQALRKHASV